METRFDFSGIVYGVAAELRQILSNLIVNAIDALQRTGNKLLVRVRNSRDWKTLSREGVRVTVADDGMGIPPRPNPIFSSRSTPPKAKGEREWGCG